MRKRLVLLLLFLVSFVSLASGANDLYVDSGYQVTYGQEITIDIECQGNSCAYSKVDVYVCGEKAASKSKTIGTFNFPITAGFDVPRDAPCGLEKHNIKVTGGHATEGDLKFTFSERLEVVSSKANPHRGDYLYLAINQDQSPPVIRQFMLSNDYWSGSTFPNLRSRDQNDPLLLVSELDGDDPFNADDNAYFNLMNRENVFSAGDLLSSFNHQDPAYDGQGDAGLDINEILHTQADQKSYDHDFFSTSYKSYWTPSSVSPVHAKDGYFPQGEIVLGKMATTRGSKNNPAQYQNHPQWHICRQDNDGMVVINRTRNGVQKRWKCDTKQSNGDFSGADHYATTETSRETGKNNWVEVGGCEDGLDNNGNGLVDGDSECNSADATEGGVGNCEPRVRHDPNLNMKYVAYGGLVSGTSCDTGTYNKRDYDVDHKGEPQIFECYSNGVVQQGVTLADRREATTICEQSANNPNAFDNHGATTGMPMVEYFTGKAAIPYGKSKWATENGFRENVDYQTLHQAEKEYSLNCLAYLGNVNCNYPDGYRHDPNLWYAHNFEETINDGYNEAGDANGAYGNQWPDYLDSWDIANGSGMNPSGEKVSKKIGEEGGIGGFVGRCPTDYIFRKSDGIYQCEFAAKEPAEDTSEVTVHMFELKADTSGNLANQNNLIGFKIPQSEYSDIQSAYIKPNVDGSDSNYNPMHVDAQCFQGNQIGRPSGEDVTNITAEVQTNDHTWVLGFIRENPSAQEKASYTCVFGFRQEYGTGNPDGSLITEGRPDQKQIDVVVKTVKPGVSDPNREEGYTSHTKQQDFLLQRLNEAEQSSNEDSTDNVNQPFQKYIREGTGFNAGASFNHPGDWYDYCRTNPNEPSCK